MKSVNLIIVGVLLLMAGCSSKTPEPQVRTLQQGKAQAVGNRPISASEPVSVREPTTPRRVKEKLMRGLMLSYTDGSVKWGSSYVYDVLIPGRWTWEKETAHKQQSDMLGGIN